MKILLLVLIGTILIIAFGWLHTSTRLAKAAAEGVRDPAEQGIIRLFQSTKKPGGGVNLAATPAHVLENVGATHMMKSYPSAEGQ